MSSAQKKIMRKRKNTRMSGDSFHMFVAAWCQNEFDVVVPELWLL